VTSCKQKTASIQTAVWQILTRC